MFAFCALYRGGDEEVNARDTLVVICNTLRGVPDKRGCRGTVDCRHRAVGATDSPAVVTVSDGRKLGAVVIDSGSSIVGKSLRSALLK